MLQWFQEAARICAAEQVEEGGNLAQEGTATCYYDQWPTGVVLTTSGVVVLAETMEEDDDDDDDDNWGSRQRVLVMLTEEDQMNNMPSVTSLIVKDKRTIQDERWEVVQTTVVNLGVEQVCWGMSDPKRNVTRSTLQEHKHKYVTQSTLQEHKHK